jgi:aminoglycoside phosphotransferase (APT) family kinase protein
MGDGKVYSERLGAISDLQFAAVAARLNLGRFVSAAPTTSGLFGQNVFLTTTAGEFVLRGAPHWVKGIDEREYRREDRWQFTKEKFFADQLHAHTKAPVPWPMRYDETSDIFGWPYLVMPRMPGRCFNEREIVKTLAPDDRRGVAVALGENLAEMQRLTSPFRRGLQPDLDYARALSGRRCRLDRARSTGDCRVMRRSARPRGPEVDRGCGGMRRRRRGEHLCPLRLQAQQPYGGEGRQPVASERVVRPA